MGIYRKTNPLLVFAAGGILIKDDKIAIIHRPKYNDWSLPKGKLHTGERFLAAAMREVAEETFCIPEVTGFAGAVYYSLEKAYKFVLFWIMTPQKINKFKANTEVDKIEWISIDIMSDWLHYVKEVELLRLVFRKRKMDYLPKHASEYHFPEQMNNLDEAKFILRQELEKMKNIGLSVRAKHIRTYLDFLYRFSGT